MRDCLPRKAELSHLQAGADSVDLYREVKCVYYNQTDRYIHIYT